ncbi:MAG: sulfotransferase [Gammaproteobacteria bacterium]
MTSPSSHDAASPTIPALLAALESGRAGELERGALRHLERFPDDVLARSLLAASLQMQGRVAEAADVHAELARRQPGEAAHWNNLGNALRELRRIDEARAAYRRACALEPRDPLTHHNLGLLAMDEGDYAAAREHLLDAHELDPSAPLTRLHAAMACHECGDFQREQRLLASWRQWPPLDADGTQDLAWLLAQDGRTDEADALLGDCIARSPDPTRAWARRVMVMERANRLDDARAAAARLPAAQAVADADVRQDVLNARAVLAMREGEWAQASQALETLLAEPGDKRKRSNLYFALARCYDRLGQPDEAMRACAEAHAAQLAGIAPLVPEAMKRSDAPLPVARQRWSPQRHAAARPVGGPAMADSPVFVVGFPRSGTTLLEQMLDAHPALCSMDERPFLQELAERLEREGLAWPDGLGELDDAACEALRGEYWRRVREVASPMPGQRLVDKNPLNLLRLPLIHRLFPQARVILALRHPCDVLLSCYMQAFRSPAFAMLCSDLDRLARGYADAMDHWLHHARLLAPIAMESRYEDLVDDVAGQVGKLGAFLELEQPERLLDFQRHARGKGFISTPSYAQVVEGINRRGLDRWHPYRRHFEPVLPVLRPYLERWGYGG